MKKATFLLCLECIAYLSMGKDKLNCREVFHNDNALCWNIRRDFPVLSPTKQNSKQNTKLSNNPSQPTKNKSKSTAAFANKAKSHHMNNHQPMSSDSRS